jgi:hypothetical protein
MSYIFGEGLQADPDKRSHCRKADVVTTERYHSDSEAKEQEHASDPVEGYEPSEQLAIQSHPTFERLTKLVRSTKKGVKKLRAVYKAVVEDNLRLREENDQLHAKLTAIRDTVS